MMIAHGIEITSALGGQCLFVVGVGVSSLYRPHAHGTAQLPSQPRVNALSMEDVRAGQMSNDVLLAHILHTDGALERCGTARVRHVRARHQMA